MTLVTSEMLYKTDLDIHSGVDGDPVHDDRVGEDDLLLDDTAGPDRGAGQVCLLTHHRVHPHTALLYLRQRWG